MSGLNPFRPKKPESPATVTAQPTSTPATSIPATSIPATSIPATSTPATAAPVPTTTTTTTTPTPTATHPASDTDENDRSSDDTDPDSTDPFGQASYVRDDGENGENKRYSKRPVPAPPARPASISSGSSILARQPSNASIDSRSLSSRPSTRERKPPPPPKNHHGKLIHPTSVSPETTARTGTTPGTPYSTKHLGPDYFTPGSSQEENQPGPGPGPETLRRSHSQYKRPPTPPLSRRHSQMTRSKSTLSKINPNRLSMPGTTDESESPPSSPGPDDSVFSKYAREDQSVVPASPLESSSPGKIPARRGSAQAQAQAQAQGLATTTPPPPPPRPRRAARPGSIISDRPSESHQQSHQQEGFPHPSNANHILEDLSRLQKEVDDLRGRYEKRKSVT